MVSIFRLKMMSHVRTFTNLVKNFVTCERSANRFLRRHFVTSPKFVMSCATRLRRPNNWTPEENIENINVNNRRRLSSNHGSPPVMHWLDLSRSGLSILERLMLEEALLRHDPLHRQWIIVGVHDPTHNLHVKFGKVEETSPKYIQPPHAIQNPNCAIVLGLGGKADESLLNLKAVQSVPPLLIKRFTGGGTVVVDYSTLFTTIIGRNADLPSVNPYPRDIMKWSADAVFAPTFEHLASLSLKEKVNKRSLVVKSKSCGIADSTRGEVVDFPNAIIKENEYTPRFALRENDYILERPNWSRKMGGNAQSIVKGGWLHHTSFLWDFLEEHMDYLSLPSKRPSYREDRPHLNFVAKLSHHYPQASPAMLFEAMKQSLIQRNHIDLLCDTTLEDVLKLIELELGGMQEWYKKCRSTVIKLK